MTHAETGSGAIAQGDNAAAASHQSVTAGQDINARDIITGIQQKFTIIFQQPFQPPPNLAQLRHDYLAYLRESYRYLDMKGLMQVQQVTQQLSLSAVYVPLKARGGHVEAHIRVAGRMMPDALEVPVLMRTAEPQLIEAALRLDPAIVVLGDPGAGKSTLLKVLALALSEQETGPLPILLPLNAYARRLQQGNISLREYLGEYYANRQGQLAQVGMLFEHAIKAKQAVILLDGLDEVQANRAHLVRLVQDFVNECSGTPLETTDEQAVASGNRVIVTSRIVGYDEAPLSGRAWRVYTLTDFDRADIARFVEQWTLAFAISVKGDGEQARQEAERERRELLAAIAHRPSVERMASNPLLLTILALIQYTGVRLPEQRVRLYELYLEALIESWNRARSLDLHPVGEGISYAKTVQVLAPLALWLRGENPTAGLVSRTDLENWLTAYYHGEEWGLPKGEARERGQTFIEGVERYSNLLLERGERQYGFLHLTLEEMLAAKGLALLAEDMDEVIAYYRDYLLDPGWHETLQLVVGVIGVIQQRPKAAGKLLTRLLDLEVGEAADRGRPVTFAGEALLDMGAENVTRPAAEHITAKLVETMQDAACDIRVRRDAGDLLGRLGWRPEPEPDDLMVVPDGAEPTGLDAFRAVPGMAVWIGKYPVTNAQYARFIEAGGYDNPAYWSADGWAWRTGTYDSKAPKDYKAWLSNRPAEKRHQPYHWEDRQWNSPLYPVVGVTWFEADAYARWLSQTQPKYEARLPYESERKAAADKHDKYKQGDTFDRAHLNCANAWPRQEPRNLSDWNQWRYSDEWPEAGPTAVTTYPQGKSQVGVWDGNGNVWEWMADMASEAQYIICGGAWELFLAYGWGYTRLQDYPENFNAAKSFRLVLALSKSS